MPATRDPRRQFLLSLLHSGLAAVDGRLRMRAALAGRDDLEHVWVLAVGKAAAAMTRGVTDAIGPRLERALVISHREGLDGGLQRDPRVRCLVAAHPVPDESSLAAGAAALGLAASVTPGRRVLLLVSGGASSLLESLAPGVTLQELQRFTRWALGAGQDIIAVNAVRRRLSRVKDGRLLEAMQSARIEGYYISDVPGDDAACVGSGLLSRGSGDEGLRAALPGWVAALASRVAPAGAAVDCERLSCVARLDDALDAIVAAAGHHVRVVRDPVRVSGDAAAVAREVCAGMRHGAPGLRVLGGETTVVLPDRPGRGGRNQHLALAAALDIAGREDLLLLAAGTDGADGVTNDAGAIVDGGTLRRGEEGGRDGATCLAAADSARFLEASGDLVHTGATGTNVGDLILALCWEPHHSLDGSPSM